MDNVVLVGSSRAPMQHIGGLGHLFANNEMQMQPCSPDVSEDVQPSVQSNSYGQLWNYTSGTSDFAGCTSRNHNGGTIWSLRGAHEEGGGCPMQTGTSPSHDARRTSSS